MILRAVILNFLGRRRSELLTNRHMRIPGDLVSDRLLPRHVRLLKMSEGFGSGCVMHVADKLLYAVLAVFAVLCGRLETNIAEIG